MLRVRRSLAAVSVLALTLPTAALGGVQTVPVTALVAEIPAAPSGWSGPETSQNAGGYGQLEMSQALATYAGPDGAVAELTYTASASMVAASAAMGTAFMNQSMVDMMNQNNPAQTIATFERDGWRGWTIVNTEKPLTELTTFNERIVVALKIDRADADALAAFIEGIDWESLGAAADDGQSRP